jgi:hypothetical protein
MHDDVASADELLNRYASVRERLMKLAPVAKSKPTNKIEKSYVVPKQEEAAPPKQVEVTPQSERKRTWTPYVPPLPDAAPHDMPIEEKVAIVLAHAPPHGTAFDPILLLQRVVASVFNLTINELIGPRRHDNICIPRQLAMTIAIELYPVSFPAVGRRFGGRDHTTALHAHRKYKDLVKQLMGRAPAVPE